MITSLSNELIVETSKLNIKKFRDEKKCFLVESPKLIFEAKKAGFELVKMFCTSEYAEKNVIKEPIEIVTEKVLSKLCSSVTPQGCIAVFKMKEEKKSSYDGNFIVLDRIQDPSNVGAILRSALGSNFLTAYLIDCADIFDAKTLRASMGSIFNLNLIKTSENELIDLIKTNKKQLFCCDMNGENVFKCSFDENCGFVVGNEGRGVSENLKKFCDKKVSIPMNEKLESLNASVSAGIVMYQVYAKKIK